MKHGSKTDGFFSNWISGPSHPHTGNYEILKASGHLVQNKVLLGSDGTVGLSLTLQPNDLATGDGPAVRNVDMVIVLDRSGSMQGRKLEDARRAVLKLLSNLSAKDRFALVTYSEGVQIASGLVNVTQDNRGHLVAAVNGVRAGGGTNLGAGLQAGINMLRTPYRSNNAARVILISDGLANRGITDLKIQIPVTTGITLADAAGYPIKVHNGQAFFYPGDLRSGQTRKLYLTLQIPTNRQRTFELDHIQIHYQHNDRPYVTTLDESLTIACVNDQGKVYSSIDKTSWSEKVVNEDFNRLKQEVASEIKTDIHGLMDQFEDQGLLLKKYLRDMEEALNQKEAKLARKISLQNRAKKEHYKYDQQYQTLDHDLTVAVQRGKDNIARMLIRKTKPLGSLCGELAGQVATLDEEISQFKGHLSAQRLQHEQLKIRSAEYFHRTERQMREKDMLDIIPSNIPGELSEEEIELELLKRKESLAPN